MLRVPLSALRLVAFLAVWFVTAASTDSATAVTTPQLQPTNIKMFHHTQGHELHRPCARMVASPADAHVRVSSAAFKDANDPLRAQLLSQCDCGNLRGCRCADAMWDSLASRPDPATHQEPGMDDQGYRQHGYTTRTT